MQKRPAHSVAMSTKHYDTICVITCWTLSSYRWAQTQKTNVFYTLSQKENDSAFTGFI